MSEQTITLKLPEGMKSIRVETAHENMVGDMLVITTNSGIVIKVDCLRLGEHEGSVGVCQWGKGEYLNDTTSISFDPVVPTEVHWC